METKADLTLMNHRSVSFKDYRPLLPSRVKDGTLWLVSRIVDGFYFPQGVGGGRSR
jgi:hypothetical protein